MQTVGGHPLPGNHGAQSCDFKYFSHHFIGTDRKTDKDRQVTHGDF